MPRDAPAVLIGLPSKQPVGPPNGLKSRLALDRTARLAVGSAHLGGSRGDGEGGACFLPGMKPRSDSRQSEYAHICPALAGASPPPGAVPLSSTRHSRAQFHTPGGRRWPAILGDVLILP